MHCSRTPCSGMSCRLTIALLSSIGFMISFGIRCNMGVAVLAMINDRKLEDGTTVVRALTQIHLPDIAS